MKYDFHCAVLWNSKSKNNFWGILCYEILWDSTNILENTARLLLSPQVISQLRFYTKLKTTQPYFFLQTYCTEFHPDRSRNMEGTKLIYALQYSKVASELIFTILTPAGQRFLKNSNVQYGIRNQLDVT